MIWGSDYSASAAPAAEVWRRWADRVEDLQLDCGHFIAEEEPQACADALLSFFRNELPSP
jgi:haloacetate dehalogenase